LLAKRRSATWEANVERVVRERERRQLTSIGRTRWREMELAGRTPPRVRLGLRAYGWLASDLEAFIRSLRSDRGAGA